MLQRLSSSEIARVITLGCDNNERKEGRKEKKPRVHKPKESARTISTNSELERLLASRKPSKLFEF